MLDRPARRRPLFRPLVGVLAWLALLVVANLDWLQRELLQFPPPWDPGFYLYLSVRYHNLLLEGTPLEVWREFNSTPLPSLFPLTTVPLYLALGTSRLVGHLTTSVYLLLMALSAYGLARRLRDEMTAGLAAFLLSTFTAVILLSRDYLGDFPFAALLTATVYALARSEDLQRRSWSLLAGVLVGLTLLSRIMAPAFLVAPIAVTLVRAWRRPHRAVALANAVRAGLAGAALAAMWWTANIKGAFDYVAFYGFGAGAVPYDPTGDPLSLGDLTFYLLAIVNDGTSLLLSSLFVLALIVRWVQRSAVPVKSGDDGRRTAARELLVAWFVVGYIALTLSRNKAPDRYTVALLPPVAIAMATALLDLEAARRRRAAVAAALLLGAYNWTSLTWKPGWAPQLAFQPPGRVLAFTPGQTWLRNPTVLSRDWPIEAVLETLSAVASEHERRAPGLGEAAVADLLDAGVSAEECVRRSYRRLLKRDPEPAALTAYLSQLETGALTRPAFLSGLLGSDEFRGRPLRVLVAADQPFFNFNTLRYYVEAERRPVDLAALPAASPDLALYDAVALLVPSHLPGQSVPMSPLEAALRADDSGFRALDRAFSEVDGWQVAIFVAAGLDRTAPWYREPIECGRWSVGGHFGRGWSSPEESFRWTDGPEAEVFVEIDPRRSRILRLSVTAFRADSPGGAREVALSFNDRSIARWTLRGALPLTRAAVLPSALFHWRNVLTLNFPHPGSAGDDRDPRALGLAAQGIRLDDFPSWPRGPVSWSGAEATPFLGDGWSWPEAGFRWSDASAAEAFFGAVPESSSLRLRLQPFVAPAWPAQRVSLSLNGRSIASWKLEHPEPRDYTVALPVEAMGPGNVLRLETPDARAPVDVGAGADTRTLGVAVHWMQLVPGGVPRQRH